MAGASCAWFARGPGTGAGAGCESTRQGALAATAVLVSVDDWKKTPRPCKACGFVFAAAALAEGRCPVCRGEVEKHLPPA